MCYIKTHHRRKLRKLKPLLNFLRRLLSAANPMAGKSQTPISGDGDDSPPFDPSIPSIPISYPLKTLAELESRSYFDSFHFPFNRASVKLSAEVALPPRPRLLVCHDLAGGYGDDRWVQGGDNPNAYAIWHWYLIDVFVYFSHDLVALPPPCWTNAAHKHGVKVLGTFIMEWEEGAKNAKKLLSTKESAFMYAERLAELANALGFDGWLINMEVKLEVEKIPNMIEFVNHLTQTMHSSVPGSLVIWYDSVTTEGNLDWQNKLNEKNKPFFDVCDGIFVNYTWEESYPAESAAVAGERKFDVYMGIDVFGRGTFGGGQWNTNVALDVIKKDDVSAAIFAPGWVFETDQPPDFQTAQNRWWGLVEKSWSVAQKYPRALPFYSNFDQGHGYHVSVDGMQLLDAPWNNISSQSLQPFLVYGEPTASGIQVSVDFKEGSYSGGGNITFRGTLNKNTHFRTRLFEGKLLLGNSPVNFTYSVKSSGTSLLGLTLALSSASGEKKSVLLAASIDLLLTHEHFSRDFDIVIMPHRVENFGAKREWVVQESRISMDQYTLTEISAVGYDLKTETCTTSSEYYATLGHIEARTPETSPSLPPANSWLFKGKNVTWSSGPENTRKLSMKLEWEPRGGDSDDRFFEYRIYVEKVSKNSNEEQSNGAEYLGAAMVKVYYVSDLEIPAGVYSLKFIVQVTINGVSQKLHDSPAYHLQVQS